MALFQQLSYILKQLRINKKYVLSPIASLALLFTICPISKVSAHHSAALFYNLGEKITLTGEVKRFNFRNPHAIVELLVTDEDGEQVLWTCETSSPSALRRRGWSQQSLVAGEIVTLEGIPASDGSLLMRIRSVTKADGSQVGVSARMDD